MTEPGHQHGWGDQVPGPSAGGAPAPNPIEPTQQLRAPMPAPGGSRFTEAATGSQWPPAAPVGAADTQPLPSTPQAAPSWPPRAATQPASPWAAPTQQGWNPNPAPAAGTPSTNSWSSPVPSVPPAQPGYGVPPAPNPAGQPQPFGYGKQGLPEQPTSHSTQPAGYPTQPTGYPSQPSSYPSQPTGNPSYPSAGAAAGASFAAVGSTAQYSQYAPSGYPAPGYAPPGMPGGYPQGPYLPPTQPKRKSGWIAGVAICLAVVLLGLGTILGYQRIQSIAAPEPTITQPVESSQPGETDPSSGSTAETKSVEVTESKGVVLIESTLDQGLGAGTGMILSADGKVLTNYHVVAGSTEVSVTVVDSSKTYQAKVLGFDASRDVALLQLNGATNLATVAVDQALPEIESQVAAVGNASGGRVLVKAPGTVTALDQDLTVSSDSPWGNTESLTGLIQTDAGAVPGDSGGPMFDSDDEVIGMTTAGSTDEGTSYAVPIADALKVVSQIETGQDLGTIRVGPAAFLGIVPAKSEESGTGRTITDVVKSSPAYQAGLRAGSKLTKVDDTIIKGSTNLAELVRSFEPGDQVRLEWTNAKGKKKSATVTMGTSTVN